MLADVVRLRWHGERLSSEVVKAADPLRGLVRLDTRHSRHSGMGRELRALLIAADEPRSLLPCLDHCRVTHISTRGVLIVGVEEVALTSRTWGEFRQAWWVRPVLPPLPPITEADRTLTR